LGKSSAPDLGGLPARLHKAGVRRMMVKFGLRRNYGRPMIFRTLWLICAMAWVLGGMSALAQQAAPKPEGYLGGLLYKGITKEEAKKLGWKTPRGLRVLELEQGGACSQRRDTGRRYHRLAGR
jgi:hypothetical protein